jgi:hypothetical protein
MVFFDWSLVCGETPLKVLRDWRLSVNVEVDGEWVVSLGFRRSEEVIWCNCTLSLSLGHDVYLVARTLQLNS